jgi:hypothetical protein
MRVLAGIFSSFGQPLKRVHLRQFKQFGITR